MNQRAPSAASAGSCTYTESRIFDALSENGSAAANAAVIRISNAPTTEVTSREPFIYRINDPGTWAFLAG